MEEKSPHEQDYNTGKIVVFELMTSTKAIWIAGLGTVFATFQLVIIGNYIVIF
ncbi:MAG: hypothetical protein ACFFFH_03230 [Candidatus Thorarchaeota archaeon]